MHFENFLEEKYGLKAERAISILKAEEINVYELLDNFVSYLTANKSSVLMPVAIPSSKSII